MTFRLFVCVASNRCGKAFIADDRHDVSCPYCSELAEAVDLSTIT